MTQIKTQAFEHLRLSVMRLDVQGRFPVKPFVFVYFCV